MSILFLKKSIKKITVATTLTDNKKYSKCEITELYRKRWMTELFLRTIKRRRNNYQLLTQPRNIFKEIPHRQKYKKFLT